MNHYSPLKVAMLFTSTTFSIVILMLFFNIITVQELSVILKLGKTETKIVQSMLDETKNITRNILGVLSQVIEKLFGWAGINNVNLELLNIDLHESNNSAQPPSNINEQDCRQGDNINCKQDK